MRIIVTSHVSFALDVPDEYIKGFTGKRPADITDEDLKWMGNETDGLGWALWEAAQNLPPGRSCDAFIELGRDLDWVEDFMFNGVEP